MHMLFNALTPVGSAVHTLTGHATIVSTCTGCRLRIILHTWPLCMRMHCMRSQLNGPQAGGPSHAHQHKWASTMRTQLFATQVHDCVCACANVFPNATLYVCANSGMVKIAKSVCKSKLNHLVSSRRFGFAYIKSMIILTKRVSTHSASNVERRRSLNTIT